MTSKKDTGEIEDSCFFICNCLGAENHALFCYLNTKDERYLEVLDSIRKSRVKILDKIVKDEKSQLYCLSKHLLAMSMGISEVANRYLERGDKKTAEDLIESAGDFQAMFLLLNDYIKDE